MKIFIPPIKSQGIKSKLVEWIKSNIENIHYDRWIEPFMGTGVVAFNIRPKKALLCDTNPHLINFYNAIKNKKITSSVVRKFLTKEGEKLLKQWKENKQIPTEMAQQLFNYVLRKNDVEVGDTVISSGLDGVYPKGLMVGSVVSVVKRSYGIFQEVAIMPGVDFEKLEEVLVVLNFPVHKYLKKK